MGRSESELRCKKHLENKQSPGVCSSCLIERLSQLSNSNSISPFASSSSPYSSAFSSPIRHRRMASETTGSISFVISDKNGLIKSRSMAFVPGIRGGEKKKGGFWSKLLGSTSKRSKEGLMHSRTVRVGS
ncbi:hypothetical protein HHK36_030709 [Tetracentron sinense]|uniref:Uncharacterized protein n=1 Tax=Tetracentron sinense TaxID=13715 RepID=A0A835CYJ1_TETSI|nr:hypothetical protein HHK36_030709 [Tetracentron sinense]